jgi:radical SAM superfamily enzyme YgiQ (UPF0313 family)
VGKKFNLVKNRDMRDSVRRIRQHNIIVVGSFIIGLDTDKPGIGRQIVEAANFYGIDILNTMVLTPLPGTRLWEKMETQGRIITNSFPNDWKYYTLTFPVANYKHLSRNDVIREVEYCDKTFYSIQRILGRLCGNFWQRHSPLAAMAANLSYRNNIRIACKAHRQFNLSGSQAIKYTSENRIRISCLKEKDALSEKYAAQPITQQKNLPDNK